MMKTQEFSDQLDRLVQELRRGVVILATLSQLKEAKYGYSLMSELAEGGLEVEQGTLYPLLRRLESQGLLESNWNVDESRPRRYYTLSADGDQMLQALAKEWQGIAAVLNKFLQEADGGM